MNIQSVMHLMLMQDMIFEQFANSSYEKSKQIFHRVISRLWNTILVIGTVAILVLEVDMHTYFINFD